jgi:hypothetical protein
MFFLIILGIKDMLYPLFAPVVQLLFGMQSWEKYYFLETGG